MTRRESCFAAALLLACGAPDAPGASPADEESTATAPSAAEETTAVSPAQAEAPEPIPVAESEGVGSVNESASGSSSRAVVAPVPGSVRVVPVADRELLGSETRALTRVERELGATFATTLASPDDEERRAARERLADRAAATPSWSGFESLVLLDLADPEVDRRGRSIARGLRGVLVVRAPGAEPALRLRASDAAGFPLSDTLGPWLLDLLRGLAPEEGDAP